MVVAFSAYSTVARDIDPGDVLIFDTNTTNIGGHYDPLTGVFTCPVDGLYAFYLTTMHSPSGALIADVMLGSTPQATAFENDSDLYDQGAVSVTVQCSAGQTVHAQHNGAASGTVVNEPSKHSVFTGFLLQAN